MRGPPRILAVEDDLLTKSVLDEAFRIGDSKSMSPRGLVKRSNCLTALEAKTGACHRHKFGS
jgi:hypothetical protein